MLYDCFGQVNVGPTILICQIVTSERERLFYNEVITRAVFDMMRHTFEAVYAGHVKVHCYIRMGDDAVLKSPL